jgi:hypothetical protein
MVGDNLIGCNPHKLRGPFDSPQHKIQARCVLIRIHEIRGRCVIIRIHEIQARCVLIRYKRDAYLCVYTYMNKNSTIEEERYRRGPVKKLLLTLTVNMVV